MWLAWPVEYVPLGQQTKYMFTPTPDFRMGKKVAATDSRTEERVRGKERERAAFFFTLQHC